MEQATQGTGRSSKRTKHIAVAPTGDPSLESAILSTMNAVTPQVLERLDRVVGEVRRLNVAVMQNAFDLGTLLLELHTKELWKVRRNETTGGPKYSTWKDFVADELYLSKSYAYALMKLPKAFTRKEIADPRLGSGKLLRVPDASTRKLMTAEVAEKRTPLREVKARVDAVVHSEGQPPRTVKAEIVARPRSVTGTLESFTHEGLVVKLPEGLAKIPIPRELAIDLFSRLGQRVTFTIDFDGA